MSAQKFIDITTADPGGPLDCLSDVFSQNDKLLEQIAEGVEGCIDEGLAGIITDPANTDVVAAIKDVIQTCLDDPTKDPAFSAALDNYIQKMLKDVDRTPITKQYISEVIQGQDINGDGVIG